MSLLSERDGGDLIAEESNGARYCELAPGTAGSPVLYPRSSAMWPMHMAPLMLWGIDETAARGPSMALRSGHHQPGCLFCTFSCPPRLGIKGSVHRTHRQARQQGRGTTLALPESESHPR